MNTDVDTFVASQSYAASTRATYTRVLNAFTTDHPDPATLSPAALLKWVEKPNWGSSHRYVALTACKTFLRWKYGANHPATVARVKRTGSGRKKRSLDKKQVNTLLASFDRFTIKGARDLAIASLAIDSGLRLAELCNLRDADTDTAALEAFVTIKGGRDGRAVFSQETALHIEHWRAMRRKQTEHLFVSTAPGSRYGQKLTREGLQTIVKKWGTAIGQKLSPHDFRRTYTRLSLKNGAPTRTVQLGGRWSNIAMVELYSQDLEQDEIRPYLPIHNL
jgi:integrase